MERIEKMEQIEFGRGEKMALLKNSVEISLTAGGASVASWEKYISHDKRSALRYGIKIAVIFLFCFPFFSILK